MKPLVSIITPTYNSEKYINETLLAVINQTYNNIEYIIIDGGSTDNTLKIIERYRSKISKIISEPDNGLSDALNKGFTIAKGEICTWIGSDDILYPCAVETAVPHFIQNSNLGLSFSNIETIDERGSITNYYNSGKTNLRYLLDINPTTPQPGSFYRLKFVRALGYLNINYKQAMDYDLFVRLMKNYDFIYIDKTLAQFRLHTKNLTVLSGPYYSPKETFFTAMNNGGNLFSSRANFLRLKAIIKYFIKKVIKK